MVSLQSLSSHLIFLNTIRKSPYKALSLQLIINQSHISYIRKHQLGWLSLPWSSYQWFRLNPINTFAFYSKFKLMRMIIQIAPWKKFSISASTISFLIIYSRTWLSKAPELINTNAKNIKHTPSLSFHFVYFIAKIADSHKYIFIYQSNPIHSRI